MTPKAEKIIQLWNAGKSYHEIELEAPTTPKTISAVKKKYPELITRENVITAKPCKDDANPQKSIQNQNISNSNVRQLIPENLNDNNIVQGGYEKLLKENETLKTELKEALKTTTKKDEQIQQLKNELSETNKNNQKYDKLFIDNKNLGRENDSLRIENDRLGKNIKNISTENDNLRINIKKYMVENDDLKLQLKKSDDNFKNLRLKIAKIQAADLKEKLLKM